MQVHTILVRRPPGGWIMTRRSFLFVPRQPSGRHRVAGASSRRAVALRRRTDVDQPGPAPAARLRGPAARQRSRPPTEGNTALLLDATLAATDIVIASLLYWYSVSGQTKRYLTTGRPAAHPRPRLQGDAFPPGAFLWASSRSPTTSLWSPIRSSGRSTTRPRTWGCPSRRGAARQRQQAR